MSEVGNVGKTESPKSEARSLKVEEVVQKAPLLESEKLKIETATIADLKDFIDKEDLQDLPKHLDIPSIENKPKPTTRNTVSSIKIEPSNTNKATSLIPSLTDLGRIATGEEEKGPQYISGNEKESFTEEEFLNYWKIYTQKAKEADKIHLFTLMNNDPILNGTEITVQIL